MANPQKLVLMVQVTRLQGVIWQSVLKSQRLGVIWEAPDANLVENLDQLKAAGLTLPDLLLVDMRLPNFNAYAFCRWCREQYPGVKVILTNSGQTEVTLSERQWAVNQGASDLFPGFHHENVVSGVAAAVKRILEILDDHPLNNGALISVLLSMKRELETRANPVKSQVYLSQPKSAMAEPPIAEPAIATVLPRRNSLAASMQRYGERAIASALQGKNGKPPADLERGLSSSACGGDSNEVDYDVTISTVKKTAPAMETLEGIYGMSSIQPSAKSRLIDPGLTGDAPLASSVDSTPGYNPPSEPVPSLEPAAPRKRPLYYRGVSHS